jgi:ATP-binding protein involved in chromosome partitioning
VSVSREAVLEALSRVIDPELRKPVTELDMVRDIQIDSGHVAVTIALTVAGCPLRASFQDQVQASVGSLPGVSEVSLEFDVMTPEEKTALTVKLRGGVTERTKGISLDRDTRVIAVSSGKGGVGKSSLTVNLAAAFSGLGLSVGVLDADVYGHSVPHMLGIRQRPVVVDRMIIPPVAHDLKLMSIGFFLDDNAPVMWRGPMLHRALEQFLSDVHWGELDMLVVDMPPGTGDVAISLGQLLPRAEVVVVTTPQPLAQEVASRAAVMAQKTNMRLVGVIENMSGDVFGTGGGAALAASLDVPLLGSVPLDPRLRECGDTGLPLVLAEPESATARGIVAIAEGIAATRRERGIGISKPLPVIS